MRIPFVPFPLRTVLIVSRQLLPISNKLTKIFPSLDLQLKQSNMKMSDEHYLSVALFTFMFWFLLVFIATFPLFARFSNVAPVLSLLLSSIISLAIFLNIIYYPKLLIVKQVRDIEKNLIFAVRYIIIQIKSGVTLFDSFESVSTAGYGKLSEEFGKMSKEVSSGISLSDSLENMIYRNPSVQLRRILWHIINSIKAGVDIGDSLSVMLENLSQEEMVELRKYGSELNPLAFLYMMFAIIFPTLGLTFLIIFSLISGFEFHKTFFVIFLTVLVTFQFAFIGIIKNRRPTIEI